MTDLSQRKKEAQEAYKAQMEQMRKQAKWRLEKEKQAYEEQLKKENDDAN